jgi:hypothetical protein
MYRYIKLIPSQLMTLQHHCFQTLAEWFTVEKSLKENYIDLLGGYNILTTLMPI